MLTGFAGDTQKQPGETQPGVKQSGGSQSDETHHAHRQADGKQQGD